MTNKIKSYIQQTFLHLPLVWYMKIISILESFFFHESTSLALKETAMSTMC